VRILLVEDDDMVGRALKAGLTQDGHATDWVQTVTAARTAWLAPSPDVVPYDAVVVDLGLPDGSGLDLIRQARARKVRSVILIVTARDRVNDRIAGLDAGADDYMVKPVDLDELSARLRAIDRRVSGRNDERRVFGELTIDEPAHVVTLRGQPIALTGQEFAVLLALARRPGAIVSRARLEEALYNWDNAVESNAIEVHIHRLRRKLGVHTIQTQRGQGYCLGEASRS
jgi:two-component system, OmpR family, response regulator QseB